MSLLPYEPPTDILFDRCIRRPAYIPMRISIARMSKATAATATFPAGGHPSSGAAFRDTCTPRAPPAAGAAAFPPFPTRRPATPGHLLPRPTGHQVPHHLPHAAPPSPPRRRRPGAAWPCIPPPWWPWWVMVGSMGSFPHAPGFSMSSRPFDLLPTFQTPIRSAGPCLPASGSAISHLLPAAFPTCRAAHELYWMS